METTIFTLPSCWACALINSDASGMDDSETAAMDTEMSQDDYKGWNIVSIVDGDEPRFTWSFRLYGGTANGGDVLDYVAIRR